jgi:hypothetical protein
MDYIGLDLPSGTYTVTLSSDDPGVEGIVVGMRGTSADVFPTFGTVTVDFGQYDHAYLVVLNLTRPPNEAGCATARYTYAVEQAAAGPTGVAYNLSAPDYEAPRVEAVHDPENMAITDPFYQTEYNIKEEIQQVALPFNPVVPYRAPAGYELDSVYGLNADEENDEFRAMNAPSGGTVAQMLFYNQEGRLIRVTESPSLYVTIGEWLAVNGLEFKPGVQIWTTGNVDAAVVDQSGGAGSGPYLVTFIVQAKFLAIDGDAPLDAMLDMAGRFARSVGMELPDPRHPIPQDMAYNP